MNNIPTVTKNLLIINVLMFMATWVAERYHIDLSDYLGLSSKFGFPTNQSPAKQSQAKPRTLPQSPQQHAAAEQLRPTRPRAKDKAAPATAAPALPL